MSEGSLSSIDRPRDTGGGLSSRPRATRSLVLWSGGLDSTYTLLRLLEQTRDEVYSHHVLVSRGDAGEHAVTCQQDAIARLHGRLIARARSFEHSQSRVDLGDVAGACMDAALLVFMAAQAARAHGFTLFDRVLLGVNADEDPGWAPDTAACALRRARLARSLRAAWGCDEVPQIYLWEPRPDKASMAAYLGRALAPATVSCLRPVAVRGGELTACAACRKCRTRAIWDAGAGALTPPGHGPAAARPRPPFRRALQSPSRTPAPAGEAAASDPPGP